MRACLVAALLLAAGCCPNGYHDRLVLDGPFPDETGDVLRAATEACGHPIVGRIEWRPDVVTSGEWGHCWWGHGCPINAWVAPDPGTGNHAAGSALAHEIGHWCLESGDEGRVRRWACAVNFRAKCYVQGLPDDCNDWRIENVCPNA